MIDARTGWYFDHVSVKGVVVRAGRVLLGLNPRLEWELPGGWPDPEDASLEETLRREVHEEAGVIIEPRGLIAAELFPVTAEQRVVIISLLATAETDMTVASAEHSDMQFFDVDALPTPIPEIYVRHIDAGIAMASGLAP